MDKVFIVHGRDASMKNRVEEFIKSLGLEPIILHKQANRGGTIIEKIEKCAEDVKYAIILLSPDDFGGIKNKRDEAKPRARQNVIFEFGLFVGLIKRSNIALLRKGDVEIPSDAAGMGYIVYSRKNNWRQDLRMELEKAGVIPAIEVYS